jgi:hypothetical protein
MSKDKKGYSIIEGCIRQSMDLPINKEKEEDPMVGEPRVYKDDNMYLYSPFKSDHEFMDKKEQENNKDKKLPWEKEDD